MLDGHMQKILLGILYMKQRHNVLKQEVSFLRKRTLRIGIIVKSKLKGCTKCEHSYSQGSLDLKKIFLYALLMSLSLIDFFFNKSS